MTDRPLVIGAIALALTVGVVGGTRALGRRPETPKPPAPVSLVTGQPPAEAETVSQVYRSDRPRSLQPSRLDAGAVRTLAERCAPSEPASVLAAIVRVESGGHPLRIRLNGKRPQVFEPASTEEAAAQAERLIAGGASVDLGLAQINSRNLPGLKLDVRAVFDPCQNMRAAGAILSRGYGAALHTSPQRQSLLQTAYSYYNTGRPERGVANGYAASVETSRAAGRR